MPEMTPLPSQSILVLGAGELGLVVQVVVAIIAPLTGNEPTGDLLEFWIYLVTAVLMPPFATLRAPPTSACG